MSNASSAAEQGSEGSDHREQRTALPTRIQVIGPRDSIRTWVRDLWSFRAVLLTLSIRDVRSKYKQAALGITWALIQPLIQVGLFTFVFAGVVNISTPAPYPLYVLSALLPFNLFQQMVMFGAPSFVNAQGIVTKVYFPRLYTVIAGGSSALVNGSISLLLLIIAMVVYGQRPTGWTLLAIPLLMATVLLGIGLAALLAAINARWRDVQHALPLLMTVLLYVSPVLYPLASVPRRLRILALLNPLSGLVDGFRSAILGVPPTSWLLTGAAFGAAAGAFVLGVFVFERTQSRLIDVL